MPIRWYQAKLAQRPLLTQVVTTAVLFGAGDIAAQQVVEKRGAKKNDWARTSRMVLYGAAVFGPGATKWYQFLQSRIKLQSHTSTIVTRLAADQLVFTPINLTLFLSYMAYMENLNAKNKMEIIKQKLKDKYWEILKVNWILWPIVQSFNFTIVPLEHRVLVVNVVALGWNCFLSYVNAEKK